MLFCSIDTDAPGRKYAQLRTAKKLQGLPSIVFLDTEGGVLVAVPSDARTVAGFRRVGARAERYVRLRKAASGDRSAEAEFLLLQLEERQVELADATARRRALRGDFDAALDAGLLATIDQRIVDLGISTEVRKAGQKKRYTLGPRFVEMLRKGPKPSAQVSRGFWFAILEWAERERDLDAFAEALTGMADALRVTDPGKPWVEGLLQRYRDKLVELQRG